MAEAAAVASIVGIANFGIKLTKVLYDFGSNVSSAREQTSYIARHVDLYASILDILTERIDNEEPILADAAFDLIEELKLQSNELFSKIEQSLPSLKDGKDDISFLQKVKWNFMKSRVALLVGELGYLRSTVHLLVTIIFTGRKIRSRSKRKVKPSKDGAPDLDNDLRKQGLKAQNALLAHHDALEKLSEFEKEAERQENFSSDDISQASTRQPITRTDVICACTPVLAKMQQSLAVYTDPTERHRVILERSVHFLQQLLQQWTTVDLSVLTGAAQEQQAQSANQQQPTVTTDGPQHGKNAAPAESPPLNHAEMHGSGYGSGTSPRTRDMGRESPLRSSKRRTTVFPAEDWIENSKRIRNNASRSSLPDRSKPTKPADDAIPPGWLKHRDPEISRFYYYDFNFNASTTKKRTSVGGGSQSSIPQSTRESAELPYKRRQFELYQGIRHCTVDVPQQGVSFISLHPLFHTQPPLLYPNHPESRDYDARWTASISGDIPTTYASTEQVSSIVWTLYNSQLPPPIYPPQTPVPPLPRVEVSPVEHSL